MSKRKQIEVGDANDVTLLDSISNQFIIENRLEKDEVTSIAMAEKTGATSSECYKYLRKLEKAGELIEYRRMGGTVVFKKVKP